MLFVLALASLTAASAIPRALVERSNLTTSANELEVPSARAWADGSDSRAPCGGMALGNREDYPISGGQISLLNRRDGTDVRLRVSFKENPKSNGDFQDFITKQDLLTRGHHCLEAVDFSTLGGAVGSPATIQLIYVAGADDATLYQCADVNFVAADAYVLPHGKFCMNGALTEETPDLETYGDKKPLSSGAKGGIGAGAAIGGLLLLAASFFGYKSYKKREVQKAIHRAEQDNKTIAGDSMAERKL